MSERSELIRKLKTRQETRTAYIAAKLGMLVPAQIRKLRISFKMPTQAHLAKAMGTQQSRVSMFETPGATNLTLDTLSRIAAALQVGLMVKFVPFSEMLRWDNEFSPNDFTVKRLEDDREFLEEKAPIGGQMMEFPYGSYLLREEVSVESSPPKPIQAGIKIDPSTQGRLWKQHNNPIEAKTVPAGD